MVKALIIGVDGQDGSYMAELLLSKGYQVTGWTPDLPGINLGNIAGILKQIELVQGDLRDQPALDALIAHTRPDEVFNLAAPSFPAGSWEDPVVVGEIAGLGVTRILEAIRRQHPAARFYQASSSEIFGAPKYEPQDENTPCLPRNPYGVAKLYAHAMVANYRQQYGQYAVSGICYNHESPRRGRLFVTRKISRGAAAIKLGLEPATERRSGGELRLGNLDARRDWGWAPDYVLAMWAMLHQSDPEDLIIGSGETHSVLEFCQLAFACLDLDYRDYVVVDPALVRPPEPIQLVADPRRAQRKLEWHNLLPFPEIVERMVLADLVQLKAAG